MSEIMTVASVPGHPGAGLMEYGRLTRAEIIRRLRAHAERQKAEAEMVLSMSDDAFDCRIVRGVHVQHLIERLDPTPSRPMENAG